MIRDTPRIECHLIAKCIPGLQIAPTARMAFAKNFNKSRTKLLHSMRLFCKLNIDHSLFSMKTVTLFLCLTVFVGHVHAQNKLPTPPAGARVEIKEPVAPLETRSEETSFNLEDSGIDDLTGSEKNSIDEMVSDIMRNKSKRLTNDSLTNGFEIFFQSFSSDNKEEIKWLHGIFGLQLESKEYKSYCLVKILTTVDKYYKSGNRNIVVTWGAGAIFLIQIEKQTTVLSVGALNVLAANVELAENSAMVHYKPFGMMGAKIQPLPSEIIKSLNVDGVANLYKIMDRMIIFRNDSTTRLTPGVIKGKLLNKDRTRYYLSTAN